VLAGEFLTIEFFSTITFLRTYIPSAPGIWDSTVPIGHIWSLNVEEHCYVLMSALTLFRLSRSGEAGVLLAAGLASIAVFLAYFKIPDLQPQWGTLGTEVAAVHVLCSAGYFLVRDRLSMFVRPWMPLLTFLLAVICYTDVAPWWSNSLLAPMLLAVTINHLHQAPRFVLWLLSTPGVRLLGIWSYSIYIWQQPFYKYSAMFPPGGALAAALAVSLASFYLFENPVRTWLNKNW
jgi:peptidoglycan/LPS O-acetylase OafA/YrhL